MRPVLRRAMLFGLHFNIRFYGLYQSFTYVLRRFRVVYLRVSIRPLNPILRNRKSVATNAILNGIRMYQGSRLRKLRFVFNRMIFHCQGVTLFCFTIKDILPYIRPRIQLFDVDPLVSRLYHHVTVRNVIRLVLRLYGRLFYNRHVTIVVRQDDMGINRFLMRITLQGTGFPSALRLLFGMFLNRSYPTIFRTFLIRYPSLSNMLLRSLVYPSARPRHPLIIRLRTSHGGRLRVVIIRTTDGLSTALVLGCSRFPGDYHLILLVIDVGFFSVLVSNQGPRVMGNHRRLLHRPSIFVLMTRLGTILILTHENGGNRMFHHEEACRYEVFLFIFRFEPQFLPQSNR